ncbi:hypothetical protein G9A89_023878 [Geosiphon pyriformis]|nr:hypothetical protein G9A89_023878 [Geosiphon pyriformis]
MSEPYTANLWYQSLANKPQDFNTFKLAFLQYFSNNNSINRLANTFTTVKTGENEAHPPMHPADLQVTVINARDFEAAKLKANHTQAVNLVINRSSNLDSKLKQIKTQIVPKINHVYYHQPINSSNKKCMLATIVVNKDICNSTKSILKSQLSVSNSGLPTKLRTISTELPTYDVAANLSNTNLSVSSTCSLSTTALIYLLTTVSTYLLAAALNNILITTNSNTIIKFSSDDIRKFQIKGYPKLEIIDGCLQTDSQLHKPVIKITPVKFKNWNYLSLLVTLEDASSNKTEPNQNKPLTSNIPPAIMENKSLTAIFSFEIKEPLEVLLFSGAAFEEKPITAIYTNTKIDGHSIKLILDSELAGSIITRQLIDQLNHQTTNTPAPLIELEKKEKKPTWEAYQLPPIPSWDDNGKEKQKEKLIWNADQVWRTNNDSDESLTWK